MDFLLLHFSLIISKWLAAVWIFFSCLVPHWQIPFSPPTKECSSSPFSQYPNQMIQHHHYRNFLTISFHALLKPEVSSWVIGFFFWFKNTSLSVPRHGTILVPILLQSHYIWLPTFKFTVLWVLSIFKASFFKIGIFSLCLHTYRKELDIPCFTEFYSREI